MDAPEQYGYWLESARSELDAAEALNDSGRWLCAAFTCQQAVEKLAEGLYILYAYDNVLRLHFINLIIRKQEDRLPRPVSAERMDFFQNLSKYWIDSCCPDCGRKLISQAGRKEAGSLLAQTKEAFERLLKLYPLTEPAPSNHPKQS
jgi:HEPN domain-containing protein